MERYVIDDIQTAKLRGDNKPFVQCIVIEGMFQGSCVGCHYNSQGVKCELRTGMHG